MTQYLETEHDQNKAEQLLKKFPKAQELQGNPPFDWSRKTILVCVIQNKTFDAAMVCAEYADYMRTQQDDPRPRRWLSFPASAFKKL
jgi:hypothetical protein